VGSSATETAVTNTNDAVHNNSFRNKIEQKNF